MFCRSLVMFLCLLLIPATVLLGADAHGGTDNAAHQESPNIFSGTLGTAILTLAIFIVLLVILGKWAWGPILSGLQKREDHIRQSIEDAENARADAEKSLTQYKEQLATAENEAQSVIDKGRTDAAHLAEEMKEKAQAEAQELRQQAQRDIASARDQALRQIYDESADLATDLAGKIISKTLNPEDHRQLLQESLSKLRTEMPEQ